ncbi:MAG: hypothetical protein A2283_10840 [Lentisphaerae bacterium RIFOXYA12_FULL_48_11]|nr:MAG: hypothetical protein A2283_10840 [Lentisphaerae bacterium RIFOXYA12_FULL_48_11]
MKICIDAREFVKNRKTGISRYLETFLPAVLEHPGFETILLVTDPESLPAVIAKYKPQCITLPKIPVLLTDQAVIPRIAEKARVDTFFSPYYKVPLSGSYRRIITVHDIMFLRLPGTNVLRKFLAGIQFRLAAGKTDVILVDSEFTKKDIIACMPGTAKKISILYPTLGKEWLDNIYNKQADEVANRHTSGKPYFLYAGNFKPHKNVHLLVEAFLKLDSETLLGTHCLILAGGDDVNTPTIRELAGPAVRNGTIRILRDVDDNELKALYAGARWFISASQYEGFGYPMLEAMISGCPVICTNLTSIPEVTGNTNIPIIRPELPEIVGAIKKALETTDSQRKELIEKGMSTAQEFISSNRPDGLLKILREL